MYTPYEIFKFWMPVISGFAFVIKAYTSTKKDLADWAERLLQNHLSHIEEATVSTVKETKQTNSLLKDSMGKTDMLQATVADHYDKNMIVWQSVLESLTVLKERTPARRTCMAKRK